MENYNVEIIMEKEAEKMCKEVNKIIKSQIKNKNKNKVEYISNILECIDDNGTTVVGTIS